MTGCNPRYPLKLVNPSGTKRVRRPWDNGPYVRSYNFCPEPHLLHRPSYPSTSIPQQDPDHRTRSSASIANSTHDHAHHIRPDQRTTTTLIMFYAQDWYSIPNKIVSCHGVYADKHVSAFRALARPATDSRVWLSARPLRRQPTALRLLENQELARPLGRRRGSLPHPRRTLSCAIHARCVCYRSCRVPLRAAAAPLLWIERYKCRKQQVVHQRSYLSH